MNQYQKELLVNRIISGQTRIKISSNQYILNRITPEVKYEASEFYLDMLNLASYYELMTEEELSIYLFRNKLWNPAKENRLLELPKEIEDSKLGIYNNISKSKERSEYRKILERQRNELDTLYNEKHCFDYLCLSGFADYMKSKFIVEKSAGILCLQDNLYEQILFQINKNRITETQYREIARNDPWRTYWLLSKNHPLFSYSVSEYSDEQRILCSWTKMYDNIYESSECPHDSVVEDDDMLDGWMIKTRRKKEEESLKKQGEDFLTNNPKIRNSGEVFVMCETKEDADKIDSLNDAYGKMIKKQRLALLVQKGTIKEQDLPDVKMNMITQANDMLSRRTRGV